MSVNTVSPITSRAGHRTSLLTLIAGGLFAVVPLVVEFVTGDAFVLMGLALLLLLCALPGLHRLQAGRDGGLGRWSVRLTVGGIIGLIAAVVGSEVVVLGEAAWMSIAAASALVALVGVISFSVAMSRARVLAPRGVWTFLGGMTLGLVSESFEQSLDGAVPWLADVLPPAGFVAAGLGLVALGLSARRIEG